MPEPTATVAGQSIALHLTGYPDIPNRWGPGHIRPTSIRLDYGNLRTPDARRAIVTGLWVRDDGEATDASLDRDYNAPNGDLTGWPPEIADLARAHAPQPPLTPCTCRQAVHIREHAGRAADGCTWCMPTPDIRPNGGPAVETVDARLLRATPES